MQVPLGISHILDHLIEETRKGDANVPNSRAALAWAMFDLISRAIAGGHSSLSIYAHLVRSVLDLLENTEEGFVLRDWGSTPASLQTPPQDLRPHISGAEVRVVEPGGSHESN